MYKEFKLCKVFLPTSAPDFFSKLRWGLSTRFMWRKNDYVLRRLFFNVVAFLISVMAIGAACLSEGDKHFIPPPFYD